MKKTIVFLLLSALLLLTGCYDFPYIGMLPEPQPVVVVRHSSPIIVHRDFYAQPQFHRGVSPKPHSVIPHQGPGRGRR